MTPGLLDRSSPTRSSSSADIPAGAPTWPHGSGRIKTSAAWLIERAGFSKGFGAALGSWSCRPLDEAHTRHHQPRQRNAEDVLLLARLIRRGVSEQFGIALQPEPTLVDVDL